MMRIFLTLCKSSDVTWVNIDAECVISAALWWRLDGDWRVALGDLKDGQVGSIQPGKAIMQSSISWSYVG